MHRKLGDLTIGNHPAKPALMRGLRGFATPTIKLPFLRLFAFVGANVLRFGIVVLALLSMLGCGGGGDLSGPAVVTSPAEGTSGGSGSGTTTTAPVSFATASSALKSGQIVTLQATGVPPKSVSASISGVPVPLIQYRNEVFFVLPRLTAGEQKLDISVSGAVFPLTFLVGETVVPPNARQTVAAALSEAMLYAAATGNGAAEAALRARVAAAQALLPNLVDTELQMIAMQLAANSELAATVPTTCEDAQAGYQKQLDVVWTLGKFAGWAAMQHSAAPSPGRAALSAVADARVGNSANRADAYITAGIKLCQAVGIRKPLSFHNESRSQRLATVAPMIYMQKLTEPLRNGEISVVRVALSGDLDLPSKGMVLGKIALGAVMREFLSWLENVNNVIIIPAKWITDFENTPTFALYVVDARDVVLSTDNPEVEIYRKTVVQRDPSKEENAIEVAFTLKGEALKSYIKEPRYCFPLKLAYKDGPPRSIEVCLEVRPPKAQNVTLSVLSTSKLTIDFRTFTSEAATFRVSIPERDGELRRVGSSFPWNDDPTADFYPATTRTQSYVTTNLYSVENGGGRAEGVMTIEVRVPSSLYWIDISSATCSRESASRAVMKVEGTAKGPVGSYISGYSTPFSDTLPMGTRVTTCRAWTSTYDYLGGLLYCQRGPNDPEDTTYTLTSPVPVTTTGVEVSLFNSSRPIYERQARVNVPLFCM
jgi:hypothetical protein